MQDLQAEHQVLGEERLEPVVVVVQCLYIGLQILEMWLIAEAEDNMNWDLEA